ncbi:MAG: hypothetical protein IKX59_02005 [Bacteroidales bacterium]|nr:hypothetical protein [Bacteroidales bacterium]
MKQLKSLVILALMMCVIANASVYEARVQALHDSILALITGAPSRVTKHDGLFDKDVKK